MTMKNKIYVLVLLGFIALSGCKKSEDLETSVNNRWAAIIANDLDKAYEYVSPGFKEIESLQSYKTRIATAKINMNWNAASYKSAKCESESVCKVQVSIEYTYTFPRRSMGSSSVNTTLVEDWINVEGDWYLVPKEK